MTLTARQKAEADVAQGKFDFLIPARLLNRTVLTAKEVGQIIGYGVNFVEREAELGNFPHYGPTGRDVTRRRYTMLGVKLWIALRMDVTPAEQMQRVKDFADTLGTAQRAELSVWLIAHPRRR